jgi:hypothetical protein
MFDAGEVIPLPIPFATARGGIGSPCGATSTTRTTTTATLAATFRALEGELINPSFLHVIGASRPRATTSAAFRLSGDAMA